MYQCKSPVVLILFNRADTLRQVIDSLRLARPKLIFAIADGPRPGLPEDVSACAETRSVLNEIDWECEVRKKFSDNNLGVGKNPAEGISWALNQVEESIILEDDCVPHPDFFRFCDELLDRFRDDSSVMMVSGDNHTLGKHDIQNSYAFTYHTQTHGWATWRRAWKKFDYYIERWPNFRSYKNLFRITSDPLASFFWMRLFEKASAEKEPPYWDYQWTLCCWMQTGRNIIPSVNLVSNVGYGSHATNTSDKNNHFANLPTYPLNFPLIHSEPDLVDKQLDRIITETVYGFTIKGTFTRIHRKAIQLFDSIRG